MNWLRLLEGVEKKRLFTVEEVRVDRFLVGCQVHQQPAAAPCLRHTVVQTL